MAESTQTNDDSVKQAAARFAEALEKLPESARIVLPLLLKNLVNGHSWEFVKNEASVEDDMKILRATEGISVAKLDRSYIVSVPFQTAYKLVVPISSGFFPQAALEKAQKANHEGQLFLKKFLDKGRDGLIGIFSLNESPTVTIKGQTFPSFSVDLGTLNQALEMYGYSYEVDGKRVTPAQMREGNTFEQFLQRCTVSPSGNAVMLTIRGPGK